MLGYKALAAGKEVLNIATAIKSGGLDAQGRPKLAVARADWERVRMDRYWGREVQFCDEDDRGRSNTTKYKFRAIFDHTSRGVQAVAVVPIVPAKHIPKAPLKNFVLLFEADWKAVPVDPILLRHIQGHLYVVMAKWDLTPLEQAALTTRLK